MTIERMGEREVPAAPPARAQPLGGSAGARALPAEYYLIRGLKSKIKNKAKRGPYEDKIRCLCLCQSNPVHL